MYIYIYFWQFGIHVYSSLPLEIHCWILAGARNVGDVGHVFRGAKATCFTPKIGWLTPFFGTKNEPHVFCLVVTGT